MGIFNEQPNYTKEKRGIRGPQGPPGPAGVGFSLNSDGNYDIETKKLTNITDGTDDSDVVSKKWIETHVSTNAPDLSLYLKKDGSTQLTGNWTVGNHQIYLPAPDHDNSATRKVYVDNHFLRRYQAIDLHNNFINRVKPGTQDTDAVNKKQMDDALASKANSATLGNYVKKDGTVAMTGNFNLNNNKIIGVKTGTADTDAVNLKQIKDTCYTLGSTGHWNARGKKIWNVNQDFTAGDVVPDMREIRRTTPTGFRLSDGNFNLQNTVLFNNSVNGHDTDIPNLAWIRARYLKLAGGTMSGNLDMNNNRIYNLPQPNGDQEPTPKKWVFDNFLNKSTGVMAGPLNMSNNKITNLAQPTNNNDVTNKTYVDTKLSTKVNSITLTNYLKKDGTVAMTGNLNLNNNKIINIADPQSDKDCATRSWVRKQIARFDHHSGDGEINVFKKINPTTVTTIYLQYISGSSYDDFTFTTSAPGQPLTSWKPTANTFINKIEFKFSAKANINVDFLWFTARDARISDSLFWVSAVKSGTWTLNIHKSFPYDMSGVHLRTLNNSKHGAITCRVFTDLPTVETINLEKLTINTKALAVASDLDMKNHKITNVKDPAVDSDVVNRGYMNNLLSIIGIRQSHQNNEFAYAMATNQWSEEDGGDDNFDIVKLDDLLPNQGNFHTYNHKVLYLKIKKHSQGGYSWEMGLNVFRLVTNQMYTLCLELIVGDVFLGQKAVITSTTAMSSGVFINGLKSQQYTYHYNDNGGQSRQSCYWRSLISLTKTGNNPHIVHIKVQMDQKGSDLSSYPSLYDRIYVIAYGISGFALDIDSNKVFDYHNAFNIEQTKVT